MNLASPKTVKEILLKYGLSPLKKFGQNFLCDENIINKIADSACISDNVLEIGPGLGVLTQALSARAKKVVCVEIDKGMTLALEETLKDCSNVTVINQDILKTDLCALQQEHFNGEPFCVCANLPYYITSKIIFMVLESDAKITSMCAMVQSEVADRLTCSAGQKDYGALTASCRYYTMPKFLFYVSSGCFYPAPDVKSAVIFMDLSAPPFDVSRKDYVKIVKAAFAMRRKTIYNNISKICSKQEATALLEKCNIDPNIRGEMLDENTFYNLAKSLK